MLANDPDIAVAGARGTGLTAFVYRDLNERPDLPPPPFPEKFFDPLWWETHPPAIIYAYWMRQGHHGRWILTNMGPSWTGETRDGFVFLRKWTAEPFISAPPCILDATNVCVIHRPNECPPKETAVVITTGATQCQ